MIKAITNNPEATAKLAEEVAASLKGGEVLALVGDLGTGKTSFIRALAKALGVNERVTSPTFVYMHVHRLEKSKDKIQKPKVEVLVHADAYRVDATALRDIGIEDYFNNPRIVVVIEWADKVKSLLPKDAIFIRFKHLGGDKRRITVGR